MKALSIKQPWAWLIVNGYKDVENRDWRYKPKYRGPLLIHASLTVDSKSASFCEMRLQSDHGISLPTVFDVGGFVGIVEMVDVVEIGEYQSPWFFGKYGFVLKNAKPGPLVKYKGQLGLFNVDGKIANEFN